MVISTWIALVFFSIEGIIFLKEVVDDLIRAQTRSEFSGRGEILCDDLGLFIQIHLIEI